MLIEETLGPDEPRAAPPGRPSAAELVLFALAYLGCAEAGHFLSFGPDAFATFWPPSGLLLAVLVARPSAAWPPFLLASLAANFAFNSAIHGMPIAIGLAFWAGNAAEAAVGAALLRRFVGAPFDCSSPKQVLGLALFGSVISTTISAVVGTGALAIAGIVPLSWPVWRVWWGADALGILLIAPPLLARQDASRDASGRVRLARAAELGLVVTALLALVGYSFGSTSPPGHPIWRLPYLYTVPFLLWCAVRFGQRTGAIVAVLFAAIVAWDTTRGTGPLAWLTSTTIDRANIIHIFLSSVLATCLLLGGAIAELRRTQQRLRSSEEAHRATAALQKAILDAANYSIISTDADGTILTFNASARRWLGYRPDEVVGKETPALIHDPSEVEARARELEGELGRPVAPGLEAFVAKARDGEADEREWTYIRKDGSRFPVRLSVTTLRDPEGRIAGFLGIGSDITEEKAAQERLRRAHEELEIRVAERTEELARANARLAEGERAFHQLADAMPQIVWATRPDGLPDYYNDRWYEFTGFDRGEPDEGNWLTILHPDDLRRSLDTWQRSIATGEPYEVHYRFRDRRTGLYRWHLGRALPSRDEEGRIIRWFGTSTDIHDLRRSEEERSYLATIVESSGDAIVSKDLDGVIKSWNLGAERIFGYDASEAVGRSAAFLMPEGREGEEAHILDRLRRGEAIQHFESTRQTKDGRLIDVSLTISPIRDRSGRAIGISKIARDITDKKESESAIRLLNANLERRVESRTMELAKAKESAEAASRAKGEFLANVSHEIRTPMNAIIGLTNLTLESSLTPMQRENLEIIKSATDSLLVLIEDLLDFSRIEAGRIRLDPVPFELREHLGDTLALLALRAHAKGLEIALHVHPDVPDRLIGDSARLRQVLINLAGNAIKFTPKGEVVIEVERGARAGDDVELRFHVKDSGIGIPEDKLGVIFKPFIQADGSTTRLYGGTGLGLAICSQLVELMGGRIWVDSEVGLGSTFHFTARLAADAEARGIPPALESLRGLRTLVVDDNDANRRILDTMLKGWGMQVALADGAPAALASLRGADDPEAPFAIIILDAQMPGVDGFALARQIRDDPAFAGVMIMMLSSTDRATTADRCHELGISVYLYKPIQERELRKAILKTIGSAGAIERAPAAPAAAPRTAQRRLRILVAEDNAHNQRVVDLMLAKDGHAATIVGDGRAAVEAWGREPFDAVLMDIQMPEMDGLQASAAIRAAEAGSGRRIPIIAMTAFARKEDRDRCLAAGMDGYVSKPVDAEGLRAAIEGCFAQQTGPPPEERPSREEVAGAWDPGAALARVNGDRPFLREMASMVLDQLPGLMGEIRDAIGAGEPRKVAASAHSLKNCFGNFVATRAFELTRELEDHGHRGNLPEAKGILESLERETGRFARALEQFTAAPQAPFEPAHRSNGDGS